MEDKKFRTFCFGTIYNRRTQEIYIRANDVMNFLYMLDIPDEIIEEVKNVVEKVKGE